MTGIRASEASREPAAPTRLDPSDRARGRRLAIVSHPAGNAFAMALTEHLPTLALLALGAGESMVGGQSAIKTGANLLQLPTLRRVARIPKRSILVRGHLLAMAGMLPLLAFDPLREAARGGSIWPAWIALVSLGVAAAGISISNTVWFPLLRAYVDPLRIGRFFGVLRSGWHLVLILFYLAATLWLARAPGDFAPLFAVVFGMGVVRLALIARMPEQSELTRQGIRVREAFAAIRESPPLRRLMTTVATGQALRGCVVPFALVLFRREIGFSEAEILTTTIALFAGGLVSLYFWGRVIDRRGAAIVFRTSSLGLAMLTLSLIGVSVAGDGAFAAGTAFFFLYAALLSGFGMADTHVLFRLTPVESPARILVAASVLASLAAALLPLVVGFALEAALERTDDRLLVYHVFFGAAAVVQAVAWWPSRGFGPDERGGDADASREPPHGASGE